MTCNDPNCKCSNHRDEVCRRCNGTGEYEAEIGPSYTVGLFCSCRAGQERRRRDEEARENYRVNGPFPF